MKKNKKKFRFSDFFPKKKAPKLPPPKNIPIIEERIETIDGQDVVIKIAEPQKPPRRPGVSLKTIHGKGRRRGLKGQNK